MEAEANMILRDLPVSTRNYTIVDNITGKPIDQETYSLTIDKEVINKLNKLKRVNEEKVRQASLRNQYSDSTLVDTFTPSDNSVFTPMYSGDYIDAQDFVKTKEEPVKPVEEEIKVEEPVFKPTEVIQQDTILSRVVARDPSTIPVEEETEPQSEQVGDNENMFAGDPNLNGEISQPTDNSIFNPEKTGLEQASEQIININTEKLGPAIKPPKAEKHGSEKIKLDKMEIREGKGVAWLAYLLFFIPLLFKKSNRFVRLHANEGLELNIMEILGGLLMLPHFLLTNITGTTQTIITLCSILGFVILAACAITIIPMMITAMCGIQFQIPWLWKKRIIYVPTERQ